MVQDRGVGGRHMQVVYYRNTDGREPVAEFIDELPAEVQFKIDWVVSLLNGLLPADPPLPFPHSSQVEGDLRELRCHHGRVLYRILYRRSEKLFVLLHIFRKGGKTVPQADKEIAANRWEDFKRRMEAIPRTPPRAAGHDAP